MKLDEMSAADIREALLSLSGDQVMSILMEINKPIIVADIMDRCDLGADRILNVGKLIDIIKLVGLEAEVTGEDTHE